MANCKLLLNDGTSFVLLNDGTSQVLLNDDTCVDVTPEPTPEKSISHVTLDAGVDLRDRKKIRSRYRDELLLKYEIETRARFFHKIDLDMQTVKKMYEDFMTQHRTTAKFKQTTATMFKTLGARVRIRRIDVEVEILTKAKRGYNEIINTLKDYLRMEDEDDA